MNTTLLCNYLQKITYIHHLCHISLFRNKSQAQPTAERKGLHKGMNTRSLATQVYLPQHAKTRGWCIHVYISVCVCVCVCVWLSRVWLFVTPWTRLLWPWDSPGKNTGLHCPVFLQGDLPDPGIEPVSPALADRFFITEAPEKLNSKTGHPEGGGPEFSLRPRKLCMYCS